MGPFDQAPFLVVWETTRACALACVHCRADAVVHRHPDELTTAEGRQLIERVRAFGDPPPLLVLTGGDPLRRPDIADLVAYGTDRGLSVSLTPSGTGAATEARLRALRDAGLARLAVSLDGASEASHDAFRGVRSSHRHTLRILDRARALGLPIQINTTVARQTVGDLPALAGQVEALGAVLWALFFLIPVGRARASAALNAAEIEGVLQWLAHLAPRAPFGVKTTEAPHFHRVLAQRAAGGGSEPGRAAPATSRADRVGRAGRAVTDGNGFVFIDHVGEICPSGFLPLPAGNVRRDDLVAVYRDSALFQALRDPARLGGRCGRCEYRTLCGGSRARAFAATGDPLAEDPGCVWEPAAAPRVTGASATPAAIAGGQDPKPGPAAADPEPGPDVARVMAALQSVFDPELGMSVVDLGLVYEVGVRDGTVHVAMTLTTPGCPIHDVMPDWVRSAILRVPGVERVDVELTFDPPWSPDRIGRRPVLRSAA